MISIENKVEKIIIETLPKELTEAIYIFGSFGTEFFDEKTSDIDIAWFPNKDIKYSDLASLEFDLCDKLNRDVDLIVPDKSNIYFLKEVLSRPPLVINSDKFCDWLDRFNDWMLDEYYFIENVIDERIGKYE